MIRSSVTRVRAQMRHWAAFGVLAAAAGGLDAGLAVEPPLRCFGNEPSWSLSLESPGVAELALMDGTAGTYHGGEVRVEARPERVWRGSPREGGPDLVAFLRETDCSDGMSNLTHPFEVRVSVDSQRVLAGCCRIVAGAAAPAVSAIEGAEWRLAQASGLDPQALAALRAAPPVRFAGGRLQGFGGCNRLAGGYTIVGERVTIGTLAGTMMSCGDDVMAVENVFAKALTGTFSFDVVEGRLSLRREAESEPVLVFAAAPPPQLEGVDWQVTGYNNGRSAVVGVHSGATVTLRFEDGVLSGNAGCNNFKGAYTRDGARLAVSSAMATTRMHCEEEVMQQEREFLAALQSAVSWDIDRGMLDMHRADGERALTASPKD